MQDDGEAGTTNTGEGRSGHCWQRVMLVVGVLLLSSLLMGKAEAQERPNVLIIIADDLTYSDLSLYGGKNVETPRIDGLADEGLVFDRAYQSMSMCVPTRSELYTGLYPVSNGAAWNHAPVRPGTESIVHHLRERGYRVGIAGKIHVRPRRAFPFERVPGVEGNPVAETASFDAAGIRAFMGRSSDEPFALVVGLTSPHMPWTVGEPGHFDPKELSLPPYLVDTPETRTYMARYLAEIEVLDRHVGQTLEALRAAGQEDETLVLFTSEQGAQWPGAKWTNWEQGVRTGLVARWPGHVPEGVRTGAMVHYADVLPTLVEAAGGDPTAHSFDGTSFMDVLEGKSDEHREYAFSMHNNVPEGPPYPIRSVTDGEFRYIRNLTPEAAYIEKHMYGVPAHNGYWGSWMFAAADREEANALVQRYMRRPAEELYHTAEDPAQLDNLADDPRFQEVKRLLGRALERWMRSEEDPGAALDTREALRERRRAARQWQQREDE